MADVNSTHGPESHLVTLFAQRRRELGLALPELARLTGIDRHRLQRLLAPGGAHIRLQEVTRIAEVLQLPRADVTRLLWPGRALLEEGDTQRLPAPDPGMTRRGGSPPPEQVPTIRLARMLTRSPNWAYSLSRVDAGPAPELQVHLMNRFALVPAPSVSPLPDHVSLRRQFLDEFGTLPPGVAFSIWRGPHSIAGRFPHDPMGGHPTRTAPHALYLQSAVYAADRPATEFPARLRGVAGSGVVVVALRGITQSLRVAATVARALGWALVDTSRVSSRITPSVVADPRASVRNELRYRNLVLGEYLAAPRPETVVNHVGTPVAGEPGNDVAEHPLLLAERDTLPFVVLMRESDALLERSVRLPANAAGQPSLLTLAQLITWRDALVAHVGALQEQGRGLVVSPPDAWASAAVTEDERDRLRWRAHTQAAQQFVQDLLHRSGVRTGFGVRDPLARALLSYDSPVSWT